MSGAEAKDPRCVASCEVVPDNLKRCVLAVGHAGDHLWVESLDRSDGRPMLVTWRDAEKRPNVIANVILRDEGQE